MKRILSITGTRADYGIYKPVFDALEQSAEIDLGLVVVGMHLRPEFGSTVDEIRADPFKIVAEVDTLGTEDTPHAMAQFAAATCAQCAEVFHEHQPDMVFVLGDRVEQLAAASAAYELGIPIAHLHGGEFTGTLDDGRRHAITQLASLHLTTAQQHADNVQAMKPHEDPAAIHVVGAPALDTIHKIDLIPAEQLLSEAGFAPALKTIVFVQHPDTDEPFSPLEQLEPSLEALGNAEANILMVGANADAGGMAINDQLKEFAASHANCQFVISLPHRTFLSWEAAADVLVGNSSSGIIEAASFNLPVVNIGDRQRGRLQSGNVIDVGYDKAAIAEAINKALNDQTFLDAVDGCKNVYWAGGAAEKIVIALEGCTV